MKVFAIRDEEEQNRKDLAYLIYYETARRFYIELPEDADPWEIPLILSSFLKKGDKTINAYWSRLWVRQRIVPTDRQNIGQILKENSLTEYDEFELLMLGNGRCAQDSYYLEPVDDSIVTKSFTDRYEKRIEDVIPLDNHRLLLFFRNGEVRLCDIDSLRKDDRCFRPVLSTAEIFERVSIEPDGYGVQWGENTSISDRELYHAGTPIPLSMTDFIRFLNNRVISTSEAAELLGCSRQNINDLVTRGKLHPVKTEQKNRFFLKSEILQRLWK